MLLLILVLAVAVEGFVQSKVMIQRTFPLKGMYVKLCAQLVMP